MTTTTPDLERLGDDLTAATERDLRRGRGRTVRRAGLALVAIALIGTGTAAAAGLLTPKQVAGGMPAGAAIFSDTHPTCVLDADGAVYHCTLSTAPAPESDDFTGVKEVLAVDDKVAGGCIGQDVAGMTWDCYLGQDAVDQEIISQDFLGEPVFGPGVG